MGPCIEYPDRERINAKGYARVPYGPQRYDAQGRKRGRSMVLLHRFVVEQVEGAPLAHGEIVMHLCDNPRCFRYDHLRRATQADNVADAAQKGRLVHHAGDDHPNTKLAVEKRDDVVAMRSAGHTFQAVADHFGISKTRVRQIVADHHATCPNWGR